MNEQAEQLRREQLRASFDGIGEARTIYSQASCDSGNDKTFAEVVANLVGASASTIGDLEDRFREESRIMQRAADLAAARGKG